MKKYPKYKKTNIEWLEQIPEHWEETRLRNLGFLYGGLSGKSSKDFNDQKNPNSKFYIPFMNIANNFRINTTFLDRVNISENEIQNEVKKGDLFFLMSSENYDDVGKTAVLDNEIPNTYLNSFCKGFRFKVDTISPLYLNYHLSSKELRHNLLTEANGFTRINLKIGKVKDLFVALPPLSEQKAIADYLDKKTNEIDQIIDAKKKLISLYNEEKSALINKAVTKGIDDKAKLKPSGVEWLGDIPQHWEVKKLNRIADITLGKTLSSKKKGDMTEEYYLRSANIDWYKPRLDSIKKMWFTPHEKSKMKVEKYDLIVSEGGDVGRTCIWNDEIENCYIQNSVHRVRFENRIEALYYLNLFVLYGKLGVYDSVVNRISIAHLTVDKISSLVFPFPPLKEQEKIVEYIEKNVRVIDKKIANAKRLIELMTEYRTTLISEVVTGKVKVV